ncbi:TRAP transporter substrate-binding protein DctP [bacterium]|nr:TRAP transporter substrate-binding protein DctP [bacterium]
MTAKKTIVLLTACALALGSGAALRAWAGDEDDEIEIKIATQAPKGTVWMNALEDMAKEVKKKTKVAFIYFPGGALGDEKVVTQSMAKGSIGGGLFTGIGLGEVLPEVRILELPFFYDNVDEIDKVKKELEPDFTKHFEEKGYVFLGWAEVGWAYIFSKVESKGLDELKKRKIWLWSGDPLAEQVFKEFDLSGTPLSLADVLQSLETGMIDSVYNSPYGLIGLQWHSKIKFMSKMTVGHGTGALLVSKKDWERIPSKKRDRVKKLCREHLDKLLATIRQKNDDSIKELQEHHGVKITEIPADEMPMYKKHGAKVAEDMAGEGRLYSKETLAKVKAVLEGVRKK